MKDYHSSHRVEYDKPERVGWLSLPVLPMLNGKKRDEVALGYVHSLRPASIRVTTGLVKCDAETWRVTVFVDKDDIIQCIKQEVAVGLPERVPYGHALEEALSYGIDSPQLDWHRIEGDVVCTTEGTWKYPRRGDRGAVEYPKPCRPTTQDSGGS